MQRRRKGKGASNGVSVGIEEGQADGDSLGAALFPLRDHSGFPQIEISLHFATDDPSLSAPRKIYTNSEAKTSSSSVSVPQALSTNFRLVSVKVMSIKYIRL